VIQRVAYLLGFVTLVKAKPNIGDGLETSNKSVSKFPGFVKTPLLAINKSMDRIDCNVMDAVEKAST